ncbi:MAG: cytochrome c [Deltaproteobacteria bacterium]|nr:cytochrome c [Deltaproteobacteria bacterium]
MNSKQPRHTRLYLLAILTGLVTIGLFLAVVFAAQKERPDYQGYDLNRPWFDGKPWPWMLDMFNQPSIKPQETGTLQQFPTDSVPRTGSEVVIPADAIRNGQLVRDLEPKNPVAASAASIAEGKKIYNTYCAPCHGPDGNANTPVTQRGMPAPPILGMVPVLSEAHLYNKARYGGPIMPPYGFQTTQKERWDLVNYMKSPQFGK